MRRFLSIFINLSILVFSVTIFVPKVFAVDVTVLEPVLSKPHLPSPGDTVTVDVSYSNIIIGANQKFVYGVTIQPPGDGYVSTPTLGSERNGPFSGTISDSFTFTIQAGACSTGSIPFQGVGFWRILTCGIGGCALNSSGQGAGDTTALADGLGATVTIHTSPSTTVDLSWTDSKGPASLSGNTNASGDVTFTSVNCNPSVSGTVRVNIGGGARIAAISAFTDIDVDGSEDVCNGATRTVSIPIGGGGPTPTPPGELTPTPTPPPTPTLPPGVCSVDPRGCGGIIGGELYEPTSGASVPGPVRFKGKWYCFPGQCVNFDADPDLSYIEIDGGAARHAFTAADFNEGLGEFDKTIPIPFGAHTFRVHIEGYSSDRGFNGVTEPFAPSGGCCGTGTITVIPPPTIPPTAPPAGVSCTISPSSTTVSPAGSKTFTFSPSGGSGSYGYAWEEWQGGSRVTSSFTPQTSVAPVSGPTSTTWQTTNRYSGLYTIQLWLWNTADVSDSASCAASGWVISSGSISGYVFVDIDEDGAWDAAEGLYTGAGAQVCLDPGPGGGCPGGGGRTRTVTGGSYTFAADTFPGGNHNVYLDAPAGFSVTTENPALSVQFPGGAYDPERIHFGIYSPDITPPPTPTPGGPTPTPTTPPPGGSCGSISGPSTLLTGESADFTASFGGVGPAPEFDWRASPLTGSPPGGSPNSGRTGTTFRWRAPTDITPSLTRVYTISSNLRPPYSGVCTPKEVQVRVPTNTCNGFALHKKDVCGGEDEGCGDAKGVEPKVFPWDNVSRVKVYQYKYPRPLAPPFEDGNWIELGEVRREPVYECLEFAGARCVRFGPTIIDYRFIPEDRQVLWVPPVEDPGTYFLGMEVFNTAGEKIASWNTGDTVNCTQDVLIEPGPVGPCESEPDERIVYPTNVKLTVSDDDVFITWDIFNPNFNDNTYEAWKSTQAGFSVNTATDRPTVSQLKEGAGSARDVFDGMGTYFYKVAPFSAARIGDASSVQGGPAIVTPSESCGVAFGPPNASGLIFDSGKFFWKSSVFSSSDTGWYLHRQEDGSRFFLSDATAECGPVPPGPWDRCHAWTMTNLLPGTYQVEGMGNCLYDLGGRSNSVVVGGAATGDFPEPPPSSVFAGGGRGLANVGFNDVTASEIGYHAYRSDTPLDLSNSVSSPSVNSYLRQVLFENLPAGKHYFAIKASNACGFGWSNYLSASIVQPWLRTEGGNTHVSDGYNIGIPETPPPTHTECRTFSGSPLCISVAGAGPSACSRDSDCAPPPEPE